MNGPGPISWPDLIQAAWPLWFALGVTVIVGTAGHWNRLVDALGPGLSRARCRLFGHDWTPWFLIGLVYKIRVCRRPACYGDPRAEQFQMSPVHRWVVK